MVSKTKNTVRNHRQKNNTPILNTATGESFKNPRKKVVKKQLVKKNTYRWWVDNRKKQAQKQLIKKTEITIKQLRAELERKLTEQVSKAILERDGNKKTKNTVSRTWVKRTEKEHKQADTQTLENVPTQCLGKIVRSMINRPVIVVKDKDFMTLPTTIPIDTPKSYSYTQNVKASEIISTLNHDILEKSENYFDYLLSFPAGNHLSIVSADKWFDDDTGNYNLVGQQIDYSLFITTKNTEPTTQTIIIKNNDKKQKTNHPKTENTQIITIFTSPEIDAKKLKKHVTTQIPVENPITLIAKKQTMDEIKVEETIKKPVAKKIIIKTTIKKASSKHEPKTIKDIVTDVLKDHGKLSYVERHAVKSFYTSITKPLLIETTRNTHETNNRYSKIYKKIENIIQQLKNKQTQEKNRKTNTNTHNTGKKTGTLIFPTDLAEIYLTTMNIEDDTHFYTPHKIKENLTSPPDELLTISLSKKQVTLEELRETINILSEAFEKTIKDKELFHYKHKFFPENNEGNIDAFPSRQEIKEALEFLTLRRAEREKAHAEFFIQTVRDVTLNNLKEAIREDKRNDNDDYLGQKIIEFESGKMLLYPVIYVYPAIGSKPFYEPRNYIEIHEKKPDLAKQKVVLSDLQGLIRTSSILLTKEYNNHYKYYPRIGTTYVYEQCRNIIQTAHEIAKYSKNNGEQSTLVKYNEYFSLLRPPAGDIEHQNNTLLLLGTATEQEPLLTLKNFFKVWVSGKNVLLGKIVNDTPVTSLTRRTLDKATKKMRLREEKIYNQIKELAEQVKRIRKENAGNHNTSHDTPVTKISEKDKKNIEKQIDEIGEQAENNVNNYASVITELCELVTDEYLGEEEWEELGMRRVIGVGKYLENKNKYQQLSNKKHGKTDKKGFAEKSLVTSKEKQPNKQQPNNNSKNSIEREERTTIIEEIVLEEQQKPNPENKNKEHAEENTDYLKIIGRKNNKAYDGGGNPYESRTNTETPSKKPKNPLTHTSIGNNNQNTHAKTRQTQNKNDTTQNSPTAQIQQEQPQEYAKKTAINIAEKIREDFWETYGSKIKTENGKKTYEERIENLGKIINELGKGNHYYHVYNKIAELERQLLEETNNEQRQHLKDKILEARLPLLIEGFIETVLYPRRQKQLSQEITEPLTRQKQTEMTIIETELDLLGRAEKIAREKCSIAKEKTTSKNKTKNRGDKTKNKTIITTCNKYFSELGKRLWKGFFAEGFAVLPAINATPKYLSAVVAPHYHSAYLPPFRQKGSNTNPLTPIEMSLFITNIMFEDGVEVDEFEYSPYAGEEEYINYCPYTEDEAETPEEKFFYKLCGELALTEYGMTDDHVRKTMSMIETIEEKTEEKIKKEIMGKKPKNSSASKLGKKYRDSLTTLHLYKMLEDMKENLLLTTSLMAYAMSPNNSSLPFISNKKKDNEKTAKTGNKEKRGSPCCITMEEIARFMGRIAWGILEYPQTTLDYVELFSETEHTSNKTKQTKTLTSKKDETKTRIEKLVEKYLEGIIKDTKEEIRKETARYSLQYKYEHTYPFVDTKTSNEIKKHEHWEDLGNIPNTIKKNFLQKEYGKIATKLGTMLLWKKYEEKKQKQE